MCFIHDNLQGDAVMRVWFKSLPFEREVDYQQASLLQALIIGLGVIVVLVIPLAILFLGRATFSVAVMGPILVILFFTIAALTLLRRGSLNGAAFLILSVIVVSQMRSLLLRGLDNNTLVSLNFPIPILFAGLTIGRNAMLVTTAIIIFFVSAVLIADKPYERNDEVFVGFLLVLGFFIFIVDRFGISLRKAFETTLRKEAELALERERLHVTLTSIGDAVMATDVHGKITFMNRVAEHVTGWEQYEAMGQPLANVFKIVNEETRKPVESPYDKVIQSGMIVGLANHTVLIKKDGQEVPIDDSGAPIRDSLGRIDGITLVFRDITERRRTERETYEHHRLVDILLQTALIINSSFDLSVVAEYILEALERVLPNTFAYIMLLSPMNIVMVRGYKENGLEKFETALKSLEDPVARLTRLQTIMKTREPLLIPDTRIQPDWMELPEGEPLRSFLGVPIISRNKVIGFIGLHSLEEDFFQEEQVPRLQFFASQIAVVLQNVQLHRHEQELAVMEDRQLLARELHDSVTQTLFASAVVAKMLPEMVKDLPEQARSQLEKLKRLNQGALSDMRTLLMELRQTDITSIELPELIQQLCTAAMGNSKLEIESHMQGNAKLPPDVHTAFYKVTQEALNNIIKHARATQAEIHLVMEPEQATLTIKDNGEGFDPDQTRSTSMGLNIMQERADASGVNLKIESQTGEGTTVSLVWNQKQ